MKNVTIICILLLLSSCYSSTTTPWGKDVHGNVIYKTTCPFIDVNACLNKSRETCSDAIHEAWGTQYSAFFSFTEILASCPK